MTRKIRNTGRAIDVSDRIPGLVKMLGNEPGLVAVYLYGSYGTPDQTPLSDIDLGLLFTDDRVPTLKGARRSHYAHHRGASRGRRVRDRPE